MRAAIVEAPMPICLDTSRVVGTDLMNEACGFRQRSSDFLHASLKLIAPTNLVMSTGFDEVDEPILSGPPLW